MLSRGYFFIADRFFALFGASFYRFIRFYRIIDDQSRPKVSGPAGLKRRKEGKDNKKEQSDRRAKGPGLSVGWSRVSN